MAKRICSGCGKVRATSPCAGCKAAGHRRRQARRGTTTQRGLGWEHQQQTARQIERVPYCERCGHTGSKDNPLTGEHGVARAHGGREVTGTLCRRCNSSSGATIRRRPHP